MTWYLKDFDLMTVTFDNAKDTSKCIDFFFPSEDLLLDLLLFLSAMNRVF